MGRFTTSDGLSLYFEDGGEGRAVLCLAGLTRNSGDFRFLVPFLPECRVIRPDYRGRGQSDFDPDPGNYTIAREARDAIELLDHLGLDRVTVIGTSRGGLIAMALAASCSDRLRGAVLNDIGPQIDPEGLARIKDYVGCPPDYADYDAAARGLQIAHQARFPGVTLARWRLQAELMWHETPQGGLSLRYDPALRKALDTPGGAAPAPDPWPMFDALARQPLAVLRGQNSDLLSAQTLADMQARAPAMHAVTVPDRGHVPFLDEAKSLAAIRWVLEATQ